MHLDARLGLVLFRDRQLQRALTAREERARNLVEVLLHRVERLVEAALDGLLQLGAYLLELGEARPEIAAIGCELVEAELLGVVLLLRERVHLAELLAALLQSLGALVQLVAVVAL